MWKSCQIPWIKETNDEIISSKAREDITSLINTKPKKYIFQMKKQEKKRSKLEVIGKKGRQEKREESGIAWEERENH